MSNAHGASETTSTLTLLFLIFLVLKLTAVIDWSWWWVTAPLWMPAALVAAFFAIATPIALASLALGKGKGLE